MRQSIFVAIEKESGKILSGAKGQYAFGTEEALNRSLSYVLRREAREQEVKARELYKVHEITRNNLLGRSEKDSSFDLKVNGKTLAVFNEDVPQAVAEFDEETIFTVASLMDLAFRAGAQGYGFTFEVIEEENE